MAIGDLYQVIVNINAGGTETEINMGYEQDAGTSTADSLEALCQAWFDDVLPTLLLALCDGTDVTQIRAITVTDHQEVPGLLQFAGQTGAVVAQTLPPTMAALIHMPTNAPDSKHNGRIYLAGVSEEGQDAGTFDAGQLTLLANFAAKLAIDLTPTAPEDTNYTPVVISRFVLGVKRTPPVGFNVLIPVAKADVRQQRKRQTRHKGLS